ncbi:MAG: FadR family transcriptional regulator [Spirochaetaceae bacterium]|nr:MAG: FadR family transcriptional regulator [Spirochaetaceae bacterium]
MELQNIKSRNLQEVIKEQIKYYIISSNLKMGDALPTEKFLSDQLGISRTVIRESLKGLQAIGLIEAVHGKGYFVKDFNFEAILDNLPYILEMHLNDFRDILEIRIVLESHYLQRLIPTYSQDDIATLYSLLGELAKKCQSDNSTKEIIDAHSRFHCELYRRSGNELLINLIKVFSTIQKNLTHLKRYQTSNPETFVEYHRRLIESIERQDATLVQDRLISHFGEAIEWVKNNSENAALLI